MRESVSKKWDKKAVRKNYFLKNLLNFRKF